MGPEPRRLILDMDPGVDDALALMLALRAPLLGDLAAPIALVGVCTSCGNVGAEQSARNVLRVLGGLAEVQEVPEVPVYVGAAQPLEGWPAERRVGAAEDIHGPGGLGKNTLPKPGREPENMPAAQFLAKAYADGGSDSVTLVVTGPLTNVAAALRHDPAIAGRIPRIVLMGGAYRVPGNISSHAEFNLWMDPHAAKAVFDSEIPITAVGLDVTHQCMLTRADLEAGLDPAKWKLGRYVEEITGHYMDFHRAREGFWGCYLHDPLALAVAFWPDLVWTQRSRVKVITEGPLAGMTASDHRDRRVFEEPAKDIAMAVDSRQFRLRFLRALSREPGG